MATTTRRVMPVRTQQIDLNGEWAGWNLTIRTNAPAGVLRHLDGLNDVDEARAVGAVAQVLDFIADITVDWNFVDERGAALPVNRAGCDALPLDLVNAIMAEYRDLGAAPKA